ncbi:MAG: extracellular solute-binding protein [Clostridia bacterium]
MGKKLLSILLVLAMLLSMVPAAFAEDIEIVDEAEDDLIEIVGETEEDLITLDDEPDDEEEGIEITVWVSDSIVDLTQQMIREYNETQAPARPIIATVEPVEEKDVYGALTYDPLAAADLFIFPQDQLYNIVQEELLDKLDDETFQFVCDENSDSSADAAQYFDGLYAYPVTEDNGYFMYYDKSVIPEEDLDSLEAIIADCEAAGRTFWFMAESGWYMSSFFFGTGCVSDWVNDGRSWTYTDTFDSEQGLAAAKGLKKLMNSSAWVNGTEGAAAFGDGNAAVMIGGVWDHYQVLQALGDNLGATDLPSFTVDDTAYHLGSFSGSKLLGVKPQGDMERAQALHALAQFLTGEEAQLTRFNEVGWGPSNLRAQQDPAVQADPAIAALIEQNTHATPQRQFPVFWWDIASELSDGIQSAGTDEELQAALALYSQRLVSATTPEPAYASGECGDELTWVLDGNVLTISGTGDMWDYTAESPAPWDPYNESIQTVVIEDGVTSIGDAAFFRCYYVESVSIPEGVTTIGYYAFQVCTHLKAVTIPASVTLIRRSAFALSGLEAIHVAEGNRAYMSMDGVLFNADGTTLIYYPNGKAGEYTVPDGVAVIENSAFSCSGLTAVSLPDSLREIREYAFWFCGSLTEISLPEGLLSIGGGAFGGTGLQEITFPASLKDCQLYDTGDAVFHDTPIENIFVAEDNPYFCSVDGVVFSKDQHELVMFPTGRTGSYTVPEGVTSLGHKAFDAVHLTEVILPDSLLTIGENSFQFARELPSITIPAGVTSVGEWAFALSSITETRFLGSAPAFGSGCFNNITATAYYPANDSSWTEDVRQDYEGTVTWIAYTSPTVVATGTCGDDLTWELDEEGTLTITGTGSMYDFAWNESPWYEDRESIKAVELPEGLTSIGAYAFSGCSSLTGIELPEGLTSIGSYAFHRSSLTSIELPSGLTSIGAYAFQSCSNLTSIEIPAGVTSIGEGAFHYCSSLTSMEAAADNTYYSSLDGVLFDKDQTTLICCPGGKSGSYAVPSGVTRIEDDAFFFCYSLASIELPEGLTNIGNDAFRFCSSLTSIEIPSDVTGIGDGAFYGCSSLTSIEAAADNTYYSSLDGVLFNKDQTTLICCPGGKSGGYAVPSGVTSIGGAAFSGCGSLTSVELPEGVTSIGGAAFSDCGSLTSVELPDGLTGIGGAAFSNCGSLTNIELPESVTSIGDFAFSSCSSLTSIEIPEGVTSIGSGAFMQCNNLTSVVLPNGLVEISEDSFRECSSLTSLSIPEGAAHIEARAFLRCGLTDVQLPNSISYIGESAFSECGDLTEIRFEGAAPAFGENCFAYVEATAYYLANDPSWTSDVMQNYGGTLTWAAYTPPTVIASGTCGENLTWTLDDQGTLSITGTGDMWDYDWDNRTEWYNYHDSIQSCVISNGATSIGDYAFNMCTALTIVTIPDSVTSVGDYAFSDCNSLTSMTIPGRVTSIGMGAFRACGSLTSITIPASVTQIREYAFSFCNSLSEIRFLGSAPEINESCFSRVTATAYYPEGDESWTEDVMQDYGGTITWIGYGTTSPIIASGECGDNLPWTLDDQGTLTITGTGDMWDFSFQSLASWDEHCFTIRSLVIEDGATSIGEFAFNNCQNLTLVSLPNSLREIRQSAFNFCVSLSEITLPEGLVKIGGGSFRYTNLREISFPASLRECQLNDCGNAVFLEAPMENIYVSPDNPVFCSVDGVMFSKDQSELVMFPTGRTGSYTVPDGVTRLGHKSMDGVCLTEVKLPDSLTEIGPQAFQFARALSTITVPANVTSIGEIAFLYSGLTEIRFEGSAPAFDEETFTSITATAYYPENDPSWTEDVRQDYGGTITWIAYNIPVDEEHFPDEIFRGYVAEVFDADGDGCLNDEEIAAVRYIGVNEKGISSLAGMEHFINLGELYCMHNSLTELDLTNNPALVDLYCAYNNLSELDLSHNPKLRMAVCYNNNLTELDLSNHAELSDVSCANNRLTVLNLSNCPSLLGVECSNNAISELDLLNKPRLDMLFCGGNSLHELDLFDLPNLNILICQNNDLAELDLSENSALAMLTCYGNHIAALDLTPCPTLLDVVTNGEFERNDNYDSYTKGSLYVRVDPTTELITGTHRHTPGDPVRENEVAATCEVNGSYDEVVYCTVCHEELSRKTVTIPAIGHDWGEPVWSWAEDYSAATATFTCKNDAQHTVTVDAESITSETIAATTTAPGKTVYTATAFLEAVPYTDTKVVENLATGWQKINDVWFYYNNGVLAIGWQKINDVWFYFSADGVMQTGWQKINNTWYYFSEGGAMQTGWQKIGSTWYYFSEGGAMQTGWQKINNTWYYFSSGGAMQTGWQKINNTWYYFSSGGAMQTGWQKIGTNWYYFSSGGAMQTGWLKLNNNWYYLDASGAMLINTSREINGKVYYFNASGVCTNP